MLGRRLNHHPAVRWEVVGDVVEGVGSRSPIHLLLQDPKPDEMWDLLLVIDEMLLIRPDFMSRCRCNTVNRRQVGSG